MRKRQKIKRLNFLGSPFDLLNQEAIVSSLTLNQERLPPFRYVVTPNADHVVRNSKNDELKSIYESAYLSVCDSQVVSRLARIKNYPISDVVPGSELTEYLFTNVLRPNHKVAVIGSNEHSIQILKQKYMLTNIAHYNPPMGFINDQVEIEKCCKFVTTNPSDFIFIAVGSPQQELLAHSIYKTAGAAGTALCIGASILFLTGQEKRAPKVFSRFGIEWLFRLTQNPKRLARRYLSNLKIFPLTLKSPKFNGVYEIRELD